MLNRFAYVFLFASLAACSTSRPVSPARGTASEHLVGDPRTSGAFAVEPTWEKAVIDSDAESTAGGGILPAPIRIPAPILLGGGGGYTGVKAGVFLPTGDLSDLDTGASAELVFGHELLSFLAVEGSVGFLSAENSMFDVQGIPLYVQARASLPITVLEFYGGIGVGTMYVDVNGQVNSGGSVGRVSKSEFAAAANAFLGAEVGIGNLAVGVEGKYQRADDVGGVEIEGTSVMVTGRLPF